MKSRIYSAIYVFNCIKFETNGSTRLKSSYLTFGAKTSSHKKITQLKSKSELVESLSCTEELQLTKTKVFNHCCEEQQQQVFLTISAVHDNATKNNNTLKNIIKQIVCFYTNLYILTTTKERKKKKKPSIDELCIPTKWWCLKHLVSCTTTVMDWVPKIRPFIF